MSKIFPNSDRVRVIFSSHAEESVYQSLKQLSDDWTVYYSCTLSSLEDTKGMVDNEIDFVLYHPKWGVLIIEVKGGRITYEPEQQNFFSQNRFGEKFLIKNPFTQALHWKSRFLRYLKKKGIKVPVTHLVCFPSIYEKDFPDRLDFERDILLGREKLNYLAQSLEDIVRRSQPSKFLVFDDVGDALDRVLRGTLFTSKLYLKDYIEFQENKLKDWQWLQDSLVSPIANAQRLAIEGEAGTGKTILASALAQYFRSTGRNVLFLSSSSILNEQLIAHLGQGIVIETYAEFASSFGVELLKRPHEFIGTREDWIQYVGPEQLKNAILRSGKRFDVLICDEAQDVQPFWWESIEAVLSPEKNNFYIFFDRSQGVFGSGSADKSFVPEDVLPIAGPYFPLIHNYRTTKEICSFSRQFRTGRKILSSYSDRLGYIPELVFYSNSEEARKKFMNLLDRLLQQEMVNSDDLTVLSARRPFHEQSIFEGFKTIGEYTLVESGAKVIQRDLGKRQIKISTIAGFKGLETRIAIVCNLSEYNLSLGNPIMASLLYVACTRAKHMLYIFVKNNDDKKNVLVQALDNVQKRGTMIVGDSGYDHVYTGTVSYYDPERIGWLTLDDSFSSSSNTIMFLPCDAKKLEIDTIIIGMRFSFRIRPEGFSSIAVEIKLLNSEKTSIQD